MSQECVQARIIAYKPRVMACMHDGWGSLLRGGDRSDPPIPTAAAAAPAARQIRSAAG